MGDSESSLVIALNPNMRSVCNDESFGQYTFLVVRLEMCINHHQMRSNDVGDGELSRDGAMGEIGQEAGQDDRKREG